jgi:hypothetical protein
LFFFGSLHFFFKTTDINFLAHLQTKFQFSAGKKEKKSNEVVHTGVSGQGLENT